MCPVRVTLALTDTLYYAHINLSFPQLLNSYTLYNSGQGRLY